MYTIFFEPVASPCNVIIKWETIARKFQKYNVNAINAHSMHITRCRIPMRIECASSVNTPLELRSRVVTLLRCLLYSFQSIADLVNRKCRSSFRLISIWSRMSLRMWDLSYVNNMASALVDFFCLRIFPFLLWIASGGSEFGMKIKAWHRTTVAC